MKKLRNKKTGEIVDGGFILIPACTGFIGNPAKSVTEINDTWEDYKPKEPLIKDKKIRRAVRAWANSFDDVDEIKASNDYKESWIDGYLIEFERSFDEVESEHTYRRTNIAELCGEDEA